MLAKLKQLYLLNYLSQIQNISDQKMIPKHHSKNLGIMIHMSILHLRNKVTFLFKSLFDSHLRQSVQVWGQGSNNVVDMIKRTQNKQLGLKTEQNLHSIFMPTTKFLNYITNTNVTKNVFLLCSVVVAETGRVFVTFSLPVLKFYNIIHYDFII